MLRLWTSLGLLSLAVLSSRSSDDEPDLPAPRPAVAIETDAPLSIDEVSCAICHEDVAREWADSAHGLAWVDSAYQKSIRRKRRAKTCYSCHVPEPLVRGSLARRAKARTDADTFHLGVTCEACHEDADGAQLGPRGAPTDAHSTRASKFLTAPGSNELCTVCHATTIGPVIGIADDLTDSGLDEEGLSCVGCHMAPVPVESSDEGVPARTRRSHALQTPRDPAFLRRAFTLTFHGDRLTLANATGHRVPGLEGRELRFELRLLDEAGELLETQRTKIDPDAYLPVRGELEVRFERSGASVQVNAEHHDPRSKDPIPFWDELLRPKAD